MFKQIVHPETGELLSTGSSEGLNLLRNYVKLSLAQRGGANRYEPPSGDELENMGMDEDEWYAQQIQPGYYADDLEDSDPDQVDLLAEKYEAVPAPVPAPKKKSSPKKAKKTPKKKSSPKKAKKAVKKTSAKKKKSPCRVNPKTKRCSRKGTKNRGACRVSPKGRCIKHKKK